MSSDLSLTWGDHRETIVGVFEKLLETSTLVDCTIAAEGQYLKAHKIILSACSPYFQLLFSQESEKNPIVVLKDIKFQELKAVIDFIYRGEVKVPEERLEVFVDAAESLQIKGLGSYNYPKVRPRNIGNEGSVVQRRRGQLSLLSRKRLRPSDFGDGRDDDSPIKEVNFGSESFEGPSPEIHVETPSSFQDGISLPLSIANHSPTSLPSCVCSETKNFETSESLSLVGNPMSPCEEEVANPDSVFVKSEPEAMAEVYIPEVDFYIDPKEEEEIAENGESEQTGGETCSELATNQSALSAMPQITSNRSESILVSPVLESSLGAVPPFASTSAAPGRRSTAAATAAPWRGGGDGREFQTNGASEDEAQAILRIYSRQHHHCPPSGASCTTVSSDDKEVPQDCQLSLKCDTGVTAPSGLSCHPPKYAGERRFACEVCGKSFLFQCDLRNHVRVHTGERPYICQVCRKSFTRSGNLTKHLKLHTAD